ncbi:MAG: polyphenol oxidase family protein, partial [Proteobacteria bacterium]|nr:polyphenol oxidase family protein [Pseudomonadota bacterium]
MIPDWPIPGNIRTLQTERTDHLGHEFDMQASELIKPEMTEFISKNGLPHLPVLMQQVHKNTVVELQTVPTSQLFTEADACFSKKVGIICTVLTADCLPILMTNRQGSIIAAIHCGWRSLHAGIIKNTLDQLNQKPNDLLVWLGPHINQKAYEVGSEMFDMF